MENRHKRKSMKDGVVEKEAEWKKPRWVINEVGFVEFNEI